MNLKVSDLLSTNAQASLEQIIDGGSHPVIELRMYAKVKDFNWQASAVECHQIEQWSLPLEGTGVVHGNVQTIDHRRHVLTTAILTANAVDTVRSDISMDAYTHLSKACVHGYMKKRYLFTNEAKYKCGPFEVDVFLMNGGAESQWVKIDLEVSDLHAEVPDLPFDVEVLIVANDNELSVEHANQISRLWQTEWQVIDPSRRPQRE